MKMRKMIFRLDMIGDTALADSLMEYAEPPAGMATIENTTRPVNTHHSMSCVYIIRGSFRSRSRGGGGGGGKTSNCELKGGKAVSVCLKHTASRGVWGHAPPGIVLFFRCSEIATPGSF